MLQGWSGIADTFQQSQSISLSFRHSSSPPQKNPFSRTPFDLPPCIPPSLSGSTTSINLELYSTTLDCASLPAVLSARANSLELQEDDPYVDRVDPGNLFSNADLCPPTVRSSPPKSLPLSTAPTKLKKDVENQLSKHATKEDKSDKESLSPQLKDGVGSEPVRDQVSGFIIFITGSCVNFVLKLSRQG